MRKILIGVVIIIIVLLIAFLVTTIEAPDPLELDPVEVSKEWIIENVGTYTERGGSNLEYVSSDTIEDNVYEIMFEFDSNFGGYGSLSEDEVDVQVVTPHTIVITIEEGKVVEAITDGLYDEINEAFLDQEEDFVLYDIYFYTVEDNQEVLASEQREFYADDPEEVVIFELLEGPSVEDNFTAIPENASLNSFSVDNGVVYLDFSSHLDASGSATVIMIREQIESTVLQFDNINEVIISIEGETEEILQP